MPVCFTLADEVDASGRALLHTPLDEKPKRVEDPRNLARVRDLVANPEVTLLVDRWDEDWGRLAWLRMHGTAELLEPDEADRPEHEVAVARLREKYPQYAWHALESRPLVRVVVERVVTWGPLRVV